MRKIDSYCGSPRSALTLAVAVDSPCSIRCPSENLPPEPQGNTYFSKRISLDDLRWHRCRIHLHKTESIHAAQRIAINISVEICSRRQASRIGLRTGPTRSDTT